MLARINFCILLIVSSVSVDLVSSAMVKFSLRLYLISRTQFGDLLVNNSEPQRSCQRYGGTAAQQLRILKSESCISSDKTIGHESMTSTLITGASSGIGLELAHVYSPRTVMI